MNKTSVSSRMDADISLMAHETYFREVKAVVFLEADDEARLLQRLARAQRDPHNQWLARLAQDARESLVTSYQPLVVRVARRYGKLAHTMELLDLVQEGNIGLLKALVDYDVAVGVAFQSVAYRHISQAIWIAIAKTDAIVRLPYDVHKVLSRYSIVKTRLRMVIGRQPLLAEVAREMGVSQEQVQEALSLQSRQNVESMQGLVEETVEDEDAFEFVSVFAAGSAAARPQKQMSAEVRRVMQAVLSPREYEFMCVLYGLDEGGTGVRSYGLMAEMMGVKKGTVASVVYRAERVLREALAPLLCGQELSLSSYVHKRASAARRSASLPSIVA